MTTITTNESTETRDNFPPTVVDILKKRAAFICSDPTCKVMTIAPSKEDENKFQYIGVAAHITAAKKGGPRYDKDLGEEKRKAIGNAIFLCNNCATKIDKNKGIDYSTELLHKWKKDHEEWILQNLNKSTFGQQITSNSNSSENQSGGINANVVNVHQLNLNSLDDKKEHDRNIFKASDQIFNEDNLDVVINSLLTDESICSITQDKIENLKYFFEKSSNEYLTHVIEESKNNFVNSLKILLNFLFIEFEIYPRDQPSLTKYKICMKPKLNIDRLGTNKPGEYQAHDKLYNELQQIVTKFEKDFRLYRKAIKTNLFI